LSLPFCQSAHVFFENQKVMYNSDGYQLGSFTTITEEESGTLKEISQETGVFHYYQNPLTGQDELACCLMPFSNASYGLIFVLSVNDLDSYMKNNISYENEHYLFTIGTQFSLSNMDSSMEDELRDMSKQFSGSKGSFPCEVITLDGAEYYAFVYEMPDISFQYIRLIPTTDIINAARDRKSVL